MVALAWVLGPGALWASGLRLPAGEDAEDWADALANAGLVLSEDGLARLVPSDGLWRLEVSDGVGRTHRVWVEPPMSAEARQDIAFLVASLVEPAGQDSWRESATSSRAPEPPAPESAAPAASPAVFELRVAEVELTEASPRAAEPMPRSARAEPEPLVPGRRATEAELLGASPRAAEPRPTDASARPAEAELPVPSLRNAEAEFRTTSPRPAEAELQPPTPEPPAAETAPAVSETGTPDPGLPEEALVSTTTPATPGPSPEPGTLSPPPPAGPALRPWMEIQGGFGWWSGWSQRLQGRAALGLQLDQDWRLGLGLLGSGALVIDETRSGDERGASLGLARRFASIGWLSATGEVTSRRFSEEGQEVDRSLVPSVVLGLRLVFRGPLGVELSPALRLRRDLRGLELEVGDQPAGELPAWDLQTALAITFAPKRDQLRRAGGT